MQREQLREAVLRAVESIPPGSVATYGDIAEYVGQGGPRQVGAIMREYGASVPWWRVIRASGVPAVVGMMLGAKIGARLLHVAPAATVRRVVIALLVLAGTRALLKGTGLWN